MDEALQVGVIGLGMGRHHVAGFNAHSQAKVVAICDQQEDRLAEIGDQNNVPGRYTDAAEMIAEENLDIVSIATPNTFHHAYTLMAFEAGAHVFCEKPMAMNAHEAREMIEAGRAADKRLMINFSYRFSPQSWALKNEVDRGTLGDIYYARTQWLRRRGMPGFGGWFGTKALSGGGPLIDLGVHRLDLALWLMGYPRPVWVMGSTYNHIASELARQQGKAFDVEDMAVALITFENGATLELEASWAANIAEEELMQTRLLGTKAGLLQHNVNGTYDFEATIYQERDGAHYDMKLRPPVPGVTSPMAHFVDALLADRPHIATGEEGLIVMELLDAIYESGAKGEPIRIQ
ncbi:MAG: Gfo/Idh/MocA family oxidoreductase [Kiritimatiellia bacterium]|jgi:predicted dehydrogenase|nr:Gfo/Idh/MocA family oxidoreductase [Kiritimatiellia bacterium]MDP6629869.1 Gfo/Idh/MocA family oxidoreductase [Kiritimatiellia bacterium]MDP6809708.1 Gfo/Idh/MocA family oxidoreductase [Kiritimatiellia bacterium]MDP7025182.1 Gfo/Idh/MocA family oxidoreductase [Kiritimatiellia bacterium]